jgi:MYXO-CTERM domain-containing protein
MMASLVCRDARAQNKPFPQQGGYAHGFVPKSISTADVVASYKNWHDKYLKTDCGSGYYRVEFLSPPGSTVSEGMGYGMLLTAYFGDKVAFDGLWRFVQKNLNRNGLMGWKVTCNGFVEGEGGGGSATDGDTDIGLALVAAVDQWGDYWRPIATKYLQTLQKIDYATCPPSGRILAKAGDWAGCDRSNTSYMMPGFWRVFREFTGDPFWGKAADDAVALWLINRNPKSGLNSNEVDQNGATFNNQTWVNYNGCRTPWRAVTDYLWYGTPGAKDVTDKVTDWTTSFGIGNLVDGYNIDGTPTPEGKNKRLNAWVGSWACGAMSKSQATVDDFASTFRSIPDDNGTYYGSSLRTLYLLTLSGNFWKPGTPPTHAAGAKTGLLDDVPSGSHTATSTACGCDVSATHDGTSVLALTSVLVLATVRRRRRY